MGSEGHASPLLVGAYVHERSSFGLYGFRFGEQKQSHWLHAWQLSQVLHVVL